MANNENLKPIKKGERLAAKPKHLHRSKALAIRLTEAEFANLGERAAAAGLSLSKYGRRALGFDKKSERDSVDVHRLIRCLEDLAREADLVFSYLEEIEPHEDHEMSMDTPHPDGYWNALFKAQSCLKANDKDHSTAQTETKNHE